MAVEKIVTCDICGSLIKKGRDESIGSFTKLKVPVIRYGPFDEECVKELEIDMCGACWDKMIEFCRTGGKGER